MVKEKITIKELQLYYETLGSVPHVKVLVRDADPDYIITFIFPQSVLKFVLDYNFKSRRYTVMLAQPTTGDDPNDTLIHSMFLYPAVDYMRDLEGRLNLEEAEDRLTMLKLIDRMLNSKDKKGTEGSVNLDTVII